MQVFLNTTVTDWVQWVPNPWTTAFALMAWKKGLLKSIGIDAWDALIFEKTEAAENGEICVVADGDGTFRLVRHYNNAQAYLRAKKDSPFEPLVGGKVVWKYVWFIKKR